MRRSLLTTACALGGLAGLACGLLEPYPGGGDPRDAFSGNGTGIQDGTPQDPLVDPPVDDSISVIDLTDCPEVDGERKSCTVAVPGQGFVVHLDFQAPNANVVGGGIRIEGEDEVQWTLLEEVKDEVSGEILFAYVLPDDACDDIPNLCHTIATEQFAVATDPDGGFAVSPPVNVDVVLQCATCDSESCVKALPPNSCRTCNQPEICQDLYDACYAPGQEGEDTDFADIFDAFLGPNGVLWTSDSGCSMGAFLCEATLESGGCEL